MGQEWCDPTKWFKDALLSKPNKTIPRNGIDTINISNKEYFLNLNESTCYNKIPYLECNDIAISGYGDFTCENLSATTIVALSVQNNIQLNHWIANTYCEYSASQLILIGNIKMDKIICDLSANCNTVIDNENTNTGTSTSIDNAGSSIDIKATLSTVNSSLKLVQSDIPEISSIQVDQLKNLNYMRVPIGYRMEQMRQRFLLSRLSSPRGDTGGRPQVRQYSSVRDFEKIWYWHPYSWSGDFNSNNFRQEILNAINILKQTIAGIVGIYDPL